MHARKSSSPTEGEPPGSSREGIARHSRILRLHCLDSGAEPASAFLDDDRVQLFLSRDTQLDQSEHKAVGDSVCTAQA